MWSSDLVPKLKKGKIFIVSGPAGSGKTTLIDLLHQEFPHCIKNVSVTTRRQRDGEIEGKDYFFTSPASFDEMVKKGEFLEHVELFGNRYGTSKTWIESRLLKGEHLFLAIDIQGAKALKGKVDADYIFIMPPSIEELQKRLDFRQTESDKDRQERLLRAKVEMEQAKFYDFVVVNDVLKDSYQVFRSIVIAKLHQVSRS